MFNTGKYRRQTIGSDSPAHFFPANSETTEVREQIAKSLLNTMLDWISDSGDVAIFDATNSRISRRRNVLRLCAMRAPELSVVFIESICYDRAELARNLLTKCRLSPDYKNMQENDTMDDLRQQISHYEAQYEPIRC